MNETQMTLDRALAIHDPYDGMLEVACLLADKAARYSEAHLTPEEQRVRLVTWVDCQVCNGGWDQWMANTTPRGLLATLDALRELGCHGTHALATAALAVAAIHADDSEEAKGHKLDLLDDAARRELSALDHRFYEPVEDYMSRCRAYIVSNRSAFAL
jgi:Domain of unknown function (DUF4375)